MANVGGMGGMGGMVLWMVVHILIFQFLLCFVYAFSQHSCSYITYSARDHLVLCYQYKLGYLVGLSSCDKMADLPGVNQSHFLFTTVLVDQGRA